MLTRRLFCHLAILIAAFSLAATTPAQSSAQTYTELDLKDGDRLLFLGDSITHQVQYTQYVEDFIFTRFPHLNIEMRNAGVSGDKAGDALLRFDEDVAAFKPTHVTVLLGMNDGSYQHFNHDIFATYERDMGLLVDKLEALDAKVVMMGPSLFDTRVAQNRPPSWIRGDEQVSAMKRYYNAVLGFYSAFLREEAERRGHGYVDMIAPMARITFEQRSENPDFTMIGDAVHPGSSGQAVMAASIIEQMGLGGNTWAADVQKTRNGWVVIGENADVSGLKGASASVSFKMQPKSLPWVLPAEARPGYEMYGASEKLSAMVLRVTGLEPGQYAVHINGELVDTLRSHSLATGVNLNDYQNTPMFEQAARVAQLNKQRNERGVKVLRDTWGRRRNRDRQRAAGADTTTDDWREWERSFANGVAQAKAVSEELLPQIKEAATPGGLRFEIIKVQ